MPTLKRRVREAAKRLSHGLFVSGQSVGIDILPRHFYSEIPDLRELRANETWKLPRSMVGVQGIDVDQQLGFAQDCCGEALRVAMLQENIHKRACKENGAEGYGPIEADFLFCFIARHRPQKIVQIGAGVSTAVVLHAASKVGYRPKIVCIDPYPTQYLNRSAEMGYITLLPKKAQEIDLSTLTALGPHDLLFVDSSHTVKPGSEVNRIILDVLPLLKGGCYVHFHDIYFPYDYMASLMKSVTFGNESALLHAFLINNSTYAIVVSLSMLHHSRPEELQTLMPNYSPALMDHGLYGAARGHFPSSTYLEVRG